MEVWATIMTPEVVALLRDWAFGIFLVAMTLIWAIENSVTAIANRNKPRCTRKHVREEPTADAIRS